jgi:5-methyltetrahydrofolate--homocysteine methyltransferase
VSVPLVSGWGTRVLDVKLADVWPLLDRNTLFRHHWGGHRAKGSEYQNIVETVFEPELARLQEDVVRDGWIDPRIAIGVFGCNADGNALVIWSPRESGREVARLHFPRQADGDGLCLSDYFRPRDSGEPDVIVLQAVTAGDRASAYIEELQRDGNYSRMLYVNGLASSTAEALAEYAHRWARRELGLPDNRGLRFSWGYQACPDLEEHRIVLGLLQADECIGLRLSTSANLDPEHSTVAMVVHHPDAKYFAMRNAA